MAASDTYTVVTESNDHDAVTVRAHPRNATYHVVDYADEDARERVADLSPGAVVRMELSRAGRRSNVWRAEHVSEGLKTSESLGAGDAPGARDTSAGFGNAERHD
ncbi:hypothetical protein JCM17823_25230 [Halorubrum gandharaense]